MANAQTARKVDDSIRVEIYDQGYTLRGTDPDHISKRGIEKPPLLTGPADHGLEGHDALLPLVRHLLPLCEVLPGRAHRPHATRAPI